MKDQQGNFVKLFFLKIQMDFCCSTNILLLNPFLAKLFITSTKFNGNIICTQFCDRHGTGQGEWDKYQDGKEAIIISKKNTSQQRRWWIQKQSKEYVHQETYG